MALFALLIGPVTKLLLKVTGYARSRSFLSRVKWGTFLPADRVDEIIRKVETRLPVLHLTCLERSLVLWSIVGEPADIRFGVRPADSGSTPKFHAWVEVEGSAIGKGDHHDYRTFVSVTSPPEKESTLPPANAAE